MEDTDQGDGLGLDDQKNVGWAPPTKTTIIDMPTYLRTVIPGSTYFFSDLSAAEVPYHTTMPENLKGSDR
jgi:hypothetical protein